jgi:3-oxoacyl-[acyl-carrier protein] reductase
LPSNAGGNAALSALNERSTLSVNAGSLRISRRHAASGSAKPLDIFTRVDLGLADKACVVTGASRGIGRETARLLCAEGANVVLVARTQKDLDDAVAKCERASQHGARALPLVLDVTDRDAGDRMVSAAGESFGRVDVLVNNAGAAKWRDLDDVPDEDWQVAWDLNVMAPLRAMRAVVPEMRKQSWGRIVNVSSTAGKRPSKNMPEYSVVKAALLSLSRLYSERCAADGVLVNAVCPGPTKSELWMGEGGLAEQSAMLSGLGSTGEALAQTASGRPIGRLAEVGEIAAAIVFLCSEQASYVAGAAWSVDGGTVPVII